MKSRYADNWNNIATALKIKEKWRCYRCGIKCFSSTQKPLSGFIDSKRRAFLLQVHHWDKIPENNEPENLVCLCAPCHLAVHRHAGSSTPGQMLLIYLSVYQSIPARAAPVIDCPVQLRLVPTTTQLSLNLFPKAEKLIEMPIRVQLVLPLAI